MCLLAFEAGHRGSTRSLHSCPSCAVLPVSPDFLQAFLDHDVGIDAVAAVRLGEVEQLVCGIELIVEGFALFDFHDAERNRQRQAAAAVQRSAQAGTLPEPVGLSVMRGPLRG